MFLHKKVVMKETINVGIDLGGSHVSIGIVDDYGKIIKQFEKDFTQEEKKDLINVAIHYIAENINILNDEYEFQKVGLGMAGAISNGVILRSVNLGIENFDITAILEKKLNKEVIVKNDAKCASLAEYKLGPCKKFKNVLFIALGTGIGGSYIYHGKLMEGSIFDGLELGHMIINTNGIECKCGKKGCFEKYASILAFKNQVIEKLNLSYDISGPDLRKKISENLGEIQEIKEKYINYLAIGISNLINIFEPDALIIGGGFARYEYLLLDELKDKLLNTNLLFNSRKNIQIQVATLGNDAGIIGASML